MSRFSRETGIFAKVCTKGKVVVTLNNAVETGDGGHDVEQVKFTTKGAKMNIGGKSAKLNSQAVLDGNMSTNPIFDIAAAVKPDGRKSRRQRILQKLKICQIGANTARTYEILGSRRKRRKQAVLDENMTEIPCSVRFRQT